MALASWSLKALPVCLTSYPSPRTSSAASLSSRFHFDGSGLTVSSSSDGDRGFSTISYATPLWAVPVALMPTVGRCDELPLVDSREPREDEGGATPLEL